MGHEVEIREAGPMAGGMMRFGIPAYRMPRDVLDAEISQIERIGVKISLNSKVEDVMAATRPWTRRAPPSAWEPKRP